MTDITKQPENSTKKQGYWAGVARDGKKMGFWFILPTFLLLLFIVIFPLFMQLYLSVTWWTPLEGIPWYRAWEVFSWGDNYVFQFTDERVWGALWRTIIIMVIAVPAQFFLGMSLAYLFMDNFPGRKIFYSLMLTPMMIVPAVVGLMFYLLFQGTGPVNAHLGLPVTFSWLTDVNRAMISVIIADVWQWTPLMFLILLAGMLGVPSDQLMAAKLLGGSNWQNFLKIILPRMKAVIIIALVLRAVECFKIFDLVYIMTKGGPGVQTETISVFLYKMTFGEFEWSYVAALGLTILFVLSILAAKGLAYIAKKDG